MTRSLTTWAPACDIYETDNEIVVKAELPEVKKDGMLRVTLPKREESKPKQIEVNVK